VRREFVQELQNRKRHCNPRFATALLSEVRESGAADDRTNFGKRAVDASTLALTGDDALHRAGMVTKKPDRQREHEGNRKTIAQGMPA
jgi:hypothetical protein